MDFEKIFLVYKKQIFTFILQWVSSKEIADDLTQEVFVKTQKSIESMKDESALQAWLYKIARNTTIDYLR